MSLILGFDLGTTSLKTILVDAQGNIRAQAEHEYPIHTPHPGWAEQDPETWWQAAIAGTRTCLAAVGEASISAIGLSGQMHGVVLLDAAGEVLAPAVIWADQRSSQQAREITERIGLARLAASAGTRVAAGFMAATLVWVQEQQPQLWRQVRWALLPKDWLRWRLTDCLATEPSDAAGTALFDQQARAWSQPILEALRIDPTILPPVIASHAVAGELTRAAASALGLPPGIPVAAGGADQATGALGAGVVDPQTMLVSLGTGGQLVAPLTAMRADPALRTHTFCHALPDAWYLLGAILSAGLAFRWLRDLLGDHDRAGGYDRLTELAATTPPGAEGLLWAPYLVGERTPYMDPGARGVLVGLTLRHGRGHLARAMMEGIALNLRNAFETMREVGIAPQRIVMAGGGARSALWRQIVADVFQREVAPLQIDAQSALGAALLGAAAVGMAPDLVAASRRWTCYGPIVQPIAAHAALYDELFDLFRQVYPQHHEDFQRLARLPC